jgi:hypothetical protein
MPQSFAKCRAFFETDWLYISSQQESKQDRTLHSDMLILGGWQGSPDGGSYVRCMPDSIPATVWSAQAMRGVLWASP